MVNPLRRDRWLVGAVELIDFYHDALILGEPINVVWTLQNGDTVTERMPALCAVDAVLNDERCGVEFKAARVKFGKLIDVWGMSA